MSVLSPNIDDAPVAFDYVSATRRLTVNGLAPNASRQLSIVYKVSRLDTIVDLMARFFPAFFPHRKWYTNMDGNIHAGTEILLFHKLK